VPVLYVLFDVLYLDGQWTTRQPYTRRRELLESLTLSGPSWQVSAAHVGEGQAMLDAARQHRLEGIMAKRLDSLYEPGVRSRSWRKIKLTHRQELVVGGWTPQQNDDRRIGSLLLGYHDCDGRLRYAGSVGTGLTQADQDRLISSMATLRTASSPFADAVPKPTAAFVRPVLVVEVEYRRWPAGGLVQQGAYKGLRPDKPAREVIKEEPLGAAGNVPHARR
jgi:bifunctional non-homologous end joining protein LigD